MDGSIPGVNEQHVRLLDPSEFYEARDLFRATVHRAPQTQQAWEAVWRQMGHGRVFGAFADGELSGTSRSFATSLCVPGGAAVSAAAVSAVGVRADKTRRGLLTALMHAELRSVRERGEPVAILHASEAGIYGRFGYGVATRQRKVSMRCESARMRSDLPSAGSVRLVDRDAFGAVLPDVYRTCCHRPGMIERPQFWWDGARYTEDARDFRMAVHANRDGQDDGYVVFTVAHEQSRDGNKKCVLCVWDLQAMTDEAAVALWRFVLGIDLVAEVLAAERPLDEPLEWWLDDRREANVLGVHDDLWVRLVDVPTALAARTYGAGETVVLAVKDAILPENSGNYRIREAGAEPTTESAQLSVDVRDLGSLYLGDVRRSTLASAGLVNVRDPKALAPADQLFATFSPPWCGTGF